MSKYSDEDLELMTIEEREAAMAEDEDVDLDEELDEELGDEVEDLGKDKGGEGGEGDEEEEPAPAEKAAEPVHTPLLTGDVPEDFDEQVTAIGTAKDDLDTKFEDGDLTTKEYRAEMDKLNKQERLLEMQEFKARTANEIAENQQRAAWAGTVNSFLEDNPVYATSKLRYKALDDTVKQVANDEANAGLTGAEILAKAHEIVESDLGSVQAPAGDPEKPAGRKTGKPAAPPNLGKLPAAEATEVGNSRWKALDRLADSDPIAYEKALAKLSEDDQDAYLGSR